MTSPETHFHFTTIAAVIGEPARATMLWNLLDGRAYTAGELALVAGISPQSASNHLAKLIEAAFLKVEKQGKHRYYRYATAEVAYAVEAIANLIPENKIAVKRTAVNGQIQFCRTCYDHLAGSVAVNISQALIRSKRLVQEGDRFTVTADGETWFNEIGIDINEVRKSKRCFARPCLDWTERKYHLAGALGAALLLQLKKNDWIRASAHSRIMILTGKGERELSIMERSAHQS